MTTVSYPPADGVYTYPFDPTGTAISNKIVGELKTLSPGAPTDFFFIIPDAAPFFREGFRIVDQNTGIELDEGIDFVFGHLFHAASVSIGKPVYGSIMMLNRARAGVVKLDYQTLGGAWTLSEAQIAVLLANTLNNPVITTWDQVQDLPYQFPPIAHDQSVVDFYGFQPFVDAVNGLADAITGTVASTSGQITDKGADLIAVDPIALVMADGYRDYLFQLNAPSIPLTIDAPVLKPGDVRHVELVLYQATGGSQIIWPSNITWATGAVGNDGGPLLTQDQGAFDVVILKYVSDELGWLGYIAS